MIQFVFLGLRQGVRRSPSSGHKKAKDSPFSRPGLVLSGG